MEITPQQKYENYEMLERSIAQLKSNTKMSEDWEQDHFNFFFKIRKAFPNFNGMYLDIHDEDVRRWLNSAEQLARYQEMHWEKTGYMNYYAYLQFLQFVKNIADNELGMTDDSGITSLLESLAVK